MFHPDTFLQNILVTVCSIVICLFSIIIQTVFDTYLISVFRLLPVLTITYVSPFALLL